MIIHPYAFFKGEIVPQRKAEIHISTNALQYGNGIFGGIRAYKADSGEINIFRLKDHFERFLRSLTILNKGIKYTADELIMITLELARKNKLSEDTYIRPFAFAKECLISPDLFPLSFDFAIYMIPLGEYLSIEKGLRLTVSNWTRTSDNMIPARAKICGGYINSSLAKADAVSLGFDDAVMLDSTGHIAEASAANFFMVRDGILITPSKHSDILEGITRKSIIKIAPDLGIRLEERIIDRTEIYLADEVFLSGTGVQIAWVKEIDGRKIGSGKIGQITDRIRKTFFSIVRGKEKKYSEWLTKV